MRLRRTQGLGGEAPDVFVLSGGEDLVLGVAGRAARIAQFKARRCWSLAKVGSDYVPAPGRSCTGRTSDDRKGAGDADSTRGQPLDVLAEALAAR